MVTGLVIWLLVGYMVQVLLYGYWLGYVLIGLVKCLLVWLYDYWHGYMVTGMDIWLLVWLYDYWVGYMLIA